MTKRKMAVWEIGKGEFATEFQAMFEKAQKLAKDNGAPVVISPKIVVCPPDAGDDRFGEINYQFKYALQGQHPVNKVTTQIDENGIVICDGKNLSDLLQESLHFEEFDDEKTLTFKTKEN